MNLADIYGMKKNDDLLTFGYLTSKPNIYSVGTAILFILLVVLTFASMGGIRDSQEVNKNVVVSIVNSGGKCVDSVCSTTTNLYTDGSFDGRSYKISPTQMNTIMSVIQDSNLTDLDVAEKPECQSFVDGQDINYVFPETYGNTMFTPCMIEGADDIELFKFLNQIVSANPVDTP